MTTLMGPPKNIMLAPLRLTPTGEDDAASLAKLFLQPRYAGARHLPDATEDVSQFSPCRL